MHQAFGLISALRRKAKNIVFSFEIPCVSPVSHDDILSFPMELRPAGRAVSAFSCWASSPAPKDYFIILCACVEYVLMCAGVLRGQKRASDSVVQDCPPCQRTPSAGVQLCLLTKDHPSWGSLCRRRGREVHQTLIWVSRHSKLPFVYNSILIACGLGDRLERTGQGRLGEGGLFCAAIGDQSSPLVNNF